ncbi:hypothetical protein M2341_000942 [Sphingobium sp. B7D2B]|uniref:hypothetical protein n=1 Tax=Sphingobium sp. B7D2B TaxID=2940583 RepID=UPI0022251618|nr:hypothetical protein [Sphingobium sp. B7D2B]MCW2365495.1 hypothetical protein [Sphingobium sp. B7D2B]
MARPRLLKGWSEPITFRGPPPAIPPEQLVLFPRKTQFELPMPEGKDVAGYIQADNNRSYYIKLDRDDNPIRANEFLSYRIADFVGIATPRCDFIQTNNGDIAFGSEAVDGFAKKAETIAFLDRYTMMEFGSSLPTFRSALSAIHALDLFINNVDRHHGNFLISGFGTERQLLALDFARSMFWRWPWADDFGSTNNSAMTWLDLRQRHGFDLSAALLVVKRLSILSADDIARMIAQMPTHWLSDALKNDLLGYCREGGWKARTELLRKGLQDGSIV